ncbi:MAG TPA: DUF5689 domain-containing protein [Cyclobacteriaceae bacterium]|nr:DUF5689 domain-containing protein [Cyclobacteriaceae bacterium]
MKSLISAEHFIRISVVLSLFAFTVSCKQEQEPTPPGTTAQFSESTLAFLENEGEKVISLTFDKPATGDGQIVLKVNTLVPQSFSTIPLAQQGQLVLPVSKGQVKAEFRMTPSDNPTLDGCKIVKFSIASTTAGIQPGSLRDMVVSVNDDEAPVEASFELEDQRFRENDPTAASINIQLNHAAPAEGILIIRLQSVSKYGVDFTTEPAAVGNKIFLHVEAGATKAAIKVFPVNDATFRADRNLDFRIIDATGSLLVGENSSLWFTITEDDGYQLSTISSILSMYEGDNTIIHGDTYIEGTVTSIDNVSPGRVVIEDGTGALQVQIITTHALTRGDLVIMNLNYGLLHEFQGAVEVSQVSVFERLGDGDWRADKMTLEALYERGGNLELQTVQLTGVTFPDANGSLPMLGDRAATDGIRTIIVRTNTFAAFRNELVPEGTLNITGIFVNIDGTYFLFPQDYNDIRRQQFMLKRD